MILTAGESSPSMVRAVDKRRGLGIMASAFLVILMAGCARGAGDAPAADAVTEMIEQCGGNRWSDMQAVADGVALRCDLQKLSGLLGEDGLWIASSRAGGEARFRIKAAGIGRGQSDALCLPDDGEVSPGDGKARFVRPDLVEECSVNAEGIRQDFIVTARPPGDGTMRLELEVSGAVVEAAAEGVSLIVRGTGRRIAYRKLHVTDATGRVLAAEFEVKPDGGLSVWVDDRSAVYPVTVDPTFSDADWSSLMSPGAWPDQPVLAAAVDTAGNLYVGGGFTKIGELPVNYVAKWDGSTWSALGGQIGQGDSHVVRSLHCIGNDVYVGGNFTTAGGVTVNNVARWDGTAWHALGAGTNGLVLTLEEWRGELYAGGRFSHAGGISVNQIARWNGVSWSALAGGVSKAVNTYYTLPTHVQCLQAAGDKLYVGGLFSSAGGVEAFSLAQWDGSQWRAVGGFRGRWMALGGGPAPWESEYSISALAEDGGTLYVASGWKFWKWNGVGWTEFGGEIGSDPEEYGHLEWDTTDMLVMDGKLHICGFFYAVGGTVVNHAARWNGTGWEPLGSGFAMWPYHPRVSCMVARGGKIYAGGFFLWAGGRLQPYLSCWSDGKWSPIGHGPAGTVKSVLQEAEQVYIAGDFKGVDGMEVNQIASRVVGTSKWKPLGGGTNGPVGALVWWDGSLYAGGGFTSAGGLAASNVARWNGTSWSPVGSGFNGPVHALAVWKGELYAGGAFTQSGAVAAGGIAKWNGSAWEAVGGGLDGGVSAMASAGGDLYVGGFFYQAGGVPASLVARWDGRQWNALGDGVGNGSWFPFVSTLAVSTSGEVYAGGFFGDAGGGPAANIAKWNGVSWSSLGQGLAGPVNALAVCGNLVYAGGGFQDTGGNPLSHVACWNGSSWGRLGSGADRAVNALFVSGTSLHVGGSFTTAGDKYANSFASVAIPVPPVITSPLTAVAREGQSFTYRITAGNAPVSYGARLLPPPGPGVPGGSATLPGGLAFDATTGLLSGTPAGSGSHQLVLTAGNAAGTGTAILNLTIEASSPVTSWAQSAGLTGADAEPDATPFEDGVPNLLKFAFNMNAGGPDRSVLADNGSSGLPRIELEQQDGKPVLRVEFVRRRNSGVVYVPERAVSLDAFTPMSGSQSVTPIDDEWERVEVVEGVSAPSDARSGFARVRVSLR